MLAKRFRFSVGRTGGQFKKIYSSPYFLLKSKRSDTGHNRFAVIISSNAVKKSVRRYFWKRQVVEHLRHWPNFKKDFLVMVSPRMEGADKKNVKPEFDAALSYLIVADGHKP